MSCCKKFRSSECIAEKIGFILAMSELETLLKYRIAHVISRIVSRQFIIRTARNDIQTKRILKINFEKTIVSNEQCLFYGKGFYFAALMIVLFWFKGVAATSTH